MIVSRTSYDGWPTEAIEGICGKTGNFIHGLLMAQNRT